jgi:hypothetical protein
VGQGFRRHLLCCQQPPSCSLHTSCAATARRQAADPPLCVP